MASALAHRGPDDDHAWADARAGVGLGFRRLAIVDLSLEGRQPMRSHCGRFVMVMNGEIYNHRELRSQLSRSDAPRWRGHSDTEVALECIARDGIPRALEQFDGMFALALWDCQERCLWLARDRFGEKPLYYGDVGCDLAFASELDALERHPEWPARLDRGALALFLRYGFVPGPLSAFEGIRKLPPGHLLRVPHGACPDAPLAWWSAARAAERSACVPFEGPMEEACDALEALVDASLARRVVADRPLGAFLSGGIDSSTVVASMARVGSDVRTFCIGFDDVRLDESPHAEAVAAHLGTQHTTREVTAAQCLDVVDELVEVYDEPFADASQIPTLVLCRAARDHVVVALSGDGGDELFGGYPRYQEAPARWRRVAHAPAIGRAAARLTLDWLGRGPGRASRALRRALGAYRHRDRVELFAARMSQWSPADGLSPLADTTASAMSACDTAGIADDALACMVYDAAGYLVDDLQVKVDRASMSVGLEVRAPLLDHRIAEFAWSLPAAFTWHAPGKRVLRAALARRVPAPLLDRPKQGFEPPIAEWLRGPLRERAEHHFSRLALGRHGLVDPAHVQARWAEHLAGRNRGHALWTVFMLGAWLDARR